MDWPARLLMFAVRRMPAERSEWGAAMLAELTELQQPAARWEFALSCTHVGLFPPRRGGFLMNDRMKYWRTNFCIAALVGLLIQGGSTFLLFITDHPETHPGLREVQFYLDFFRGWLLLSFVLTPIVSGLRTGESRSVKQWLIPLGAAVLFGLLLTAPLAWMEWWNNPVIRSGEYPFPFVLFLGLWLAPTIFFLGATPIVRGLRAGQSVLAHPMRLLLRVGLLAFLALGWVALVRDQMPCFLGGVPGCD
jgi:hypothetical protein